ncbi:NAD(P)/FAD-dependent oxidoreductase [Rathayibacter sp. KR2-224]|uniref:NAD(P)/FAD-dependent oxidoreductase n=1 Tax=Rathayibacter sp. KR2-224 TaxID=3400913 RepID=UPI003C01DB3D
MTSQEHILILGGGYAGFNLARGLRGGVKAGRVRVTLVEPLPYLTYKPLLPEVAGGETQPRDATVTLQDSLKHVRIIPGDALAVDLDAHTAVVRAEDGVERPLSYDHVVFALGSITKALPIPGLEDNAVGFGTLEEAVFLRNHVLDRIRYAAATRDAAERERALTFVFIGGGYTGVEAIAELYELARHEFAAFPSLRGRHMTWLLVEVADRIAVEVGPELSQWTLKTLRQRGIRVLLKTELQSCEDGIVQLSDGSRHPADTIVWSAGVTPNPLLGRLGVPTGPKGHVLANECLQVTRDDGTVVKGAWALGDNAQVPQPNSGSKPSYYPPNAQNALRQAKLLAQNLLGAQLNEPALPYRHQSLGTLASYGRHQGAAVIKGIKLRGWPAWVVDKAYHAMAIPSMSRRIRLATGWLANALARRDLTSTSAAMSPRRPFHEAIAAAKEHQSQAKH